MSKVTVYDLITDGLKDNAYQKIQNVEIAPRKAIEMIIHKYSTLRDYLETRIEANTENKVASPLEIGMKTVAEDVIGYSMQLLSRFEEDEK